MVWKIFKRRRMELTPKKALFLCMEQNARAFHGDQTFWRELHAINYELTPGCISVEDFTEQEARNLQTGRSSKRAFHPGERTVVIKLQKKETARRGAELLNELFKGTGTHFVAEIPHGSTAPQIRSNIDKNHSSKLSVISSFYFDRDVTHAKEREDLHKNCQEIIDGYLGQSEKTEHRWMAREGVLPFVSLMGLHGNLRPLEHKKFNRKQKEKELNEPHPRGDPMLFKDVVVHVEMNHDGSIYSVIYNPTRSAWQRARGHLSPRNWLLELCGGDWSDESIPPSIRALRITGFIYGMKDLLIEQNPEILTMAGAVSTVVYGADVYRKINDGNHKLENRQQWLEKERARQIEIKSRPPVIEYAVEAMQPTVVDPKLHDGHIHRSQDHVDLNPAAVERSARVQFLRNIMQEGAKGPTPELVKAKTAHLKHRR